ncbi:YtxH domain-containing protein [Ferruginibacter sp.]|nr:YtxH domain-containing protein [Ferruginibacter sp.]
MNNTGKIVTAVAAGAAAGAILGVLFAPDKGSETRRKINDQGKKIAEGVKAKLQKGVEKVNGLKDNIAKTVIDKAEELAG